MTLMQVADEVLPEPTWRGLSISGDPMTPKPPSEDSVETQLAVINTKLDILIEQRSDHEARIRLLEETIAPKAERTAQEARLRSLEQFKWALVGACVAGGGTAGAIVTKLIGG